MKTFKHFGKIGDVIYSLPTIKAMGGGVLYLPESTPESPRLYSNLKPLLEQQPYIHEVKEYPSGLGYLEQVPGIHIDVDLDLHRTHNNRGHLNMVLRYFQVFGIKADHKQPWLTIEGPRLIEHDYNLINLTPRFRDGSTVNWKKVFAAIPKPVYFIGTEDEHSQFVDKIAPIERLCTADFLTFALYIKYCSALFCNQSASVTIAQSIGKSYYLEKKPRKTNVLFNTPNEHVLV